MRYLLLLLASMMPFGLSAASKENAMITNLNVIRNAFHVRYAPLEWKKKNAKWDLDKKIDSAAQHIQKNPSLSVDHYQDLVRDLVFSAEDMGCMVLFYSTERAILPFEVEGAEERYFVTQVFEEALPLKTGDEILLFDQRPIAEVVKELKVGLFGKRDSVWNKAISEQMLTLRGAQFGLRNIPQGPITITYRSKSSGSEESFVTEWLYTPEEIHNNMVLSQEDPISQHPWRNNKRINPLHQMTRTARFQSNEMMESGEEKGFAFEQRKFLEGAMPPKSWILWETEKESPFKGCLFKTPSNRTIGYIRLPSFEYESEEAKKMAEAFGSLLRELQLKSEALVIDQTHHDLGGNLFYTYALLSMLTKKPLAVPPVRMKIDQKYALMSAKFAELTELLLLSLAEEEEEALHEITDGYHLDPDYYQRLIAGMRFVAEQWNAGHCMTEPFHPSGVDRILPHPAWRYHKPILLLVDYTNGNTSEIFAAILQDNQRAVIMGTETSGTMGQMCIESYPNRFGISGLIFQREILERKGRDSKENMSVIPDIPYSLTARDLTEGYADYYNAINQALEELLGTK